MADRFEDLRTFVAIVDHGGVNAAAAAMGIARSAISRRLSDLEARIGVTLIERTTRRFEPTSAGRAYLARARALLTSIDELDSGFAGAFGASAVTVSAADPLAFAAVLPAVAAFLAANSDAAVSLVAGAEAPHADVQLEMRDGDQNISAARRLVCASPAYLELRGRPASSNDLADHVAISTPGDTEHWRRATGAARPTVALAATDDSTALAAALLGVGLSLLPEALLAPLVAHGELELALADVAPPAEAVSATLGAEPGAAATMLVDAISGVSRKK